MQGDREHRTRGQMRTLSASNHLFYGGDYFLGGVMVVNIVGNKLFV